MKHFRSENAHRVLFALYVEVEEWTHASVIGAAEDAVSGAVEGVAYGAVDGAVDNAVHAAVFDAVNATA